MARELSMTITIRGESMSRYYLDKKWVAIQNGIRDAYLHGKIDDEQKHPYYILAYEHMTRLTKVKEKIECGIE